jgi:hypothetical protein
VVGDEGLDVAEGISEALDGGFQEALGVRDDDFDCVRHGADFFDWIVLFIPSD